MITKTIIIRYKFFWFLWSMKTRNWRQNCFDTEVNPRKKIQYINSDKIIKLSGESMKDEAIWEYFFGITDILYQDDIKKEKIYKL